VDLNYVQLIPLELPRETTLEYLYKISNQNIWFLIWILKKIRFWPDLTREVLEAPFTVKRLYSWPGGKISYLEIRQNDSYHVVMRSWHENGRLAMEQHGRKWQQNGFTRSWYRNSQLTFEEYWKEGQTHGVSRHWAENGDFITEERWNDNTHDELDELNECGNGYQLMGVFINIFILFGLAIWQFNLNFHFQDKK